MKTLLAFAVVCLSLLSIAGCLTSRGVANPDNKDLRDFLNQKDTRIALEACAIGLGKTLQDADETETFNAMNSYLQLMGYDKGLPELVRAVANDAVATFAQLTSEDAKQELIAALGSVYRVSLFLYGDEVTEWFTPALAAQIAAK